MTVTTPVATARSSAGVAVLGIVGASVAATAIWAVASLLDVEFKVRFGDGEPIDVTAVSVVGASLAASLVGWGLLALLRRLTAKGLTVWTILASVAALASLSGPLTASGTVGTKLSLAAMHLAVAIVDITVLRRSVK